MRTTIGFFNTIELVSSTQNIYCQFVIVVLVRAGWTWSLKYCGKLQMPARKQLGLEFNDKAEFSVFTLAKENYYLWPNTSFTFVKRICTRHCQRNRAQNDINTTTTSKRQFVFFLLVSGAGPPKIAQNVRTCEHWGSKSHIFCGRSHIFCWGCANGGGWVFTKL